MKTAEIKDLLKKDVLIIQIPDGFQCSECDENYYISSIEDDTTLKSFSKIDYTLLGKTDEISEEDARELAEAPEPYWDDDKNPKVIGNAKWSYAKSLLSLIESEIYWENPFEKPEYDEDYQEEWYECQYKSLLFEWHQAELRTFDRKRTLIFKKNK